MQEYEMFDDGLRILNKWGPVLITIIFLFLNYIFLRRTFISKQYIFDEKLLKIDQLILDIKRLQESRHRIRNSMTKLQIDIEKKASYDWFKKELFPKIDSLANDVNRIYKEINDFEKSNSGISDTER